MTFDWRGFLDIAAHLEQCHGAASEEAALRCAVSRAYYAAFCYTRNRAVGNGFQLTGSDKDHSDLREFLKKKRKRELAEHLNRLRQLRNWCDYDDHIAGRLPLIHKEAIDKAKRIISSAF